MTCESLGRAARSNRLWSRPVPNQDSAQVGMQAKLKVLSQLVLQPSTAPLGGAVEGRGLSILGAAAGELLGFGRGSCGLGSRTESCMGALLPPWNPAWGCIPGD